MVVVFYAISKKKQHPTYFIKDAVNFLNIYFTTLVVVGL